MGVDLYTIEKLRNMSAASLSQLYTNALKSNRLEAAELVSLIESLDTEIVFETGLSADHPIYRQLEEIINSDEAQGLLIDAAAAGLPGLAGVEPLIVKKMGAKYSKTNTGTKTAGAFVAIKMRQLGYNSSIDGPMPAGSVAKRALIWEPNS